MSGPYPPQGHPQQPGQGGWSGGQPAGGVPAGQYGPPSYEFPAVGYGGLSGQDQGGWGVDQSGGWGSDQGNWPGNQGQPHQVQSHQGQPPQGPPHQGPPNQPPQGPPGQGPNQVQPPRRKRNTGQIVIAIVAVLVIVGGVATGILLLHNRGQQQASPPPATSQPAPTGTQGGDTGSSQPTDSSTGNSANGTTTLTVSPGECVTAAVAGSQYAVTKQATCGGASSDFILDKAVTSVDGCSVHQYVVVQGAPGTVYCFTLDLKVGDCVDVNYLKVACTGAAFTVIKTEAGPGTDTSCRDAVGAKHWLPADRNPVQVACIGPPSS
jgi:hypothetical protein